MRAGYFIAIVAALGCLQFGAAAGAEATDIPRLEAQRAAFRKAYERAELGDFRVAEQFRGLLEDYLLWPDLRGAWLQTRIRNDDYDGVEPFLASYGDSRPGRELRYRYALALGRKQRYDQYLAVYRTHYERLGVARLDCLALQADIEAGDEALIPVRGMDAWLIGRNQVEECDPVFEHMRQRGLLAEEAYGERFELAVDERQFAIARYLSRSLPPAYARRARQWTSAVDDPAAFLEAHASLDGGEDFLDQLAYAVERLAYDDPERAAVLWRDIGSRYPFPGEVHESLGRHVALWAARRHSTEAMRLLSGIGASSRDVEVLRWSARAGLLGGDWQYVIDSIGEMPEPERDRSEWRYWLAYATQRAGKAAAAAAAFEALADERDFYGFLAADAVGADYALQGIPLIADEAAIANLESRTAFQRARELFMVGLESRGRSEWDAAISLLSAGEKRQAAILAHRWGWHSRAIATVATVDQYDDLALRYPLPYRESFASHSGSSGVAESWAYGVARSESLFMRDIRSTAGAVGIMQLLPETGRRTAQELNLPWSGQLTLTDPDANIRLGTAYLRRLLDRFGEHRLLATAAYNAGPLNVDAWLPRDGEIDARIWMANIPYNETRAYVSRVLAADVIFQWRLSGRPERLSIALADSVAAPSPPAVGARPAAPGH